MGVDARHAAVRDEGGVHSGALDVPVANDNEIRRFRADLQSNPDLAAAVYAKGADLAGVARLANEFGYAFTADAFEETMRARTRRMLDDRQLAEKGASWVHMGAPGPLTLVVVVVEVSVVIEIAVTVYVA